MSEDKKATVKRAPAGWDVIYDGWLVMFLTEKSARDAARAFERGTETPDDNYLSRRLNGATP